MCCGSLADLERAPRPSPVGLLHTLTFHDWKNRYNPRRERTWSSRKPPPPTNLRQNDKNLGGDHGCIGPDSKDNICIH